MIERIRHLITTEPVRAHTTLRTTLILLTALGVTLAPTQIAAILALAAILLDIKTSETVRSSVTPTTNPGQHPTQPHEQPTNT